MAAQPSNPANTAGSASTAASTPPGRAVRAVAAPVEPLLLGLAGLLVACVLVTAVVAERHVHAAAARTAQSAAELVAHQVREHLSGYEGERAAALAQVCAVLISEKGDVLNVTLLRPGQPPHIWRPASASLLRPARTATGRSAPAADGPSEEIRVEMGVAGSHGATLAVGAYSAGVLCAGLGAYAWLYRRLKHRLRPLEAIAGGLDARAAGVETDLHALRVSDSLGAAATAWNGILQELATLRELETEAGGGGKGDVLAQVARHELQRTLDAIPCGVLHLDAGQRIVFANATAGELLRCETEGLAGRGLAEVLGAERAQRVAAGGGARGTARFVDEDFSGADDPRLLRFERRNGQPRPDAALLFIQDVTHLKEAERTRDNFLYHVTHELRTPLTNIAAYAETLGKPDFDDEQTRRECYNVIIGETKRLSGLIEDILNISQMEVGTLALEWTGVDLSKLARKTVQDHLGAADEKGIELSLELSPKLPALRGDKHRLAVLLHNLIGNAVKYTPGGGKVRVTLEADATHVHLAVHDTGIGIAESEQANVFEKFYRVKSDEVQSQKGTGIGLAICREVVSLHGGDIRLRSKPGHGSTFFVDLPIGDLSAAAPAGTHEAGASA